MLLILKSTEQDRQVLWQGLPFGARTLCPALCQLCTYVADVALDRPPHVHINITSPVVSRPYKVYTVSEREAYSTLLGASRALL